MDGNSKEEFCTMCSVEVPSAFRNDDEDENIDEIAVVKKENCFNMSKIISKWFIKIFMVLIILVFIYILFKKPDLKK